MPRRLPNLYQLPAVRRDDGKRPGLPVESTELLQKILDGYLAQLSDADLCEANILELCMSIRGADECNDPDDPLWEAACARLGLTKRFDEAPTWRETFLGLCKEIAQLTKKKKRVLWEDVPVVEAEGFDYDFTDQDWTEDSEEEVKTYRHAVIGFWINCVRKGSRYTMAYLLNKFPLLVNALEWIFVMEFWEDQWGYVGDTALMIATKKGDLKMVKFLLEHDADVDDVNAYGWTALMYAVDARKVEIVRVLADFGADPLVDGEDRGAMSEGETAIDMIASRREDGEGGRWEDAAIATILGEALLNR